VRISKDPTVRRNEILAAAADLFRSQGYKHTAVETIIRKAGIAKGTFYYYFQSKDDVLAAIVQDLVRHLAEHARSIAADPSLGALEKTRLLLRGTTQSIQADNRAVLDSLRLPENRELHERSNVEMILAFGPIMAGVIEQGNREGVFHVERPLETAQFLLAGSLFLYDSDLFTWTPAERVAHANAMQAVIERALGASTGSFAFLSAAAGASSGAPS
jgi:AcrR family transcriptional regulator